MSQRALQILINDFERVKNRNPKYSLRSHAKKLGLQASALSEVFNGKRKLSKKMAKKSLGQLGLPGAEVDSIVDGTPKDEQQFLDLEYFKIISEWQYFAILSLAELPDFQSSAKWVSKRLNISERDAKNSLEKLKELELLFEDETGRLKPTVWELILVATKRATGEMQSSVLILRKTFSPLSSTISSKESGVGTLMSTMTMLVMSTR